MENKANFNTEVLKSVGLNVIAKGLGFISTILVSIYIGSSIGLDLFFLSTGVIGAIHGILFVQTTYVIVPNGTKIKLEEGFNASIHYFNKYFLILLGILLPLFCF